MTIFIDTSIVMYAVGAEHPLRRPCAAILERISSGSLDATTSVEVVQELVHRNVTIRRPEEAARLAELTMALFAPVLPISHAVMRRIPGLIRRYPTLQARDLTHVATCIHEGIAEILTADRGFDQVTELRRIDPLAFVA